MTVKKRVKTIFEFHILPTTIYPILYKYIIRSKEVTVSSTKKTIKYAIFS